MLRSQAADPDSIRARRPRLVAITDEALERGRSLVEPLVLTHKFAVKSIRHNRITIEGGGHFTGPLITEHLGGAESIVVMLCTIGDKLGWEATAESASNLSLGFALDAVGSAAVHALSAAACNAIERQAAAAGLQTSLPLSPGMKGWGVDPGQHKIFSLIDPAEVGVTVMPTLEMHPLKSVTAVIGVGAEIAIKGAICDYRPLDDTCRHKIA